MKGKKQRQPHRLDLIMLAGQILLESGAEIQRIESTLQHMAQALKLADFQTYVVSQGLMVSATNRKGLPEAKTLSTTHSATNLAKLEAVNTLSRQLSQQTSLDPSQIYAKLQAIDQMAAPALTSTLLAYFFGASGFSLALGSQLAEAAVAGITGLLLCLFLHWIRQKIQANFLLTILASSLITLTAHLLTQWGWGDQPGLIILGTLMILLPGATFVNAIREFSQNNLTTGVILLGSAIITCSTISAGVAGTLAVLPMAQQITESFVAAPLQLSSLFIRTLSAGIGTVAFAMLYHAPSRYYWDLGCLGASTWLLYLLIYQATQLEPLAILLPAILVAFCSQILATRRKCPTTIFLSTSMFPLMPGLSIYRAIYFLITGADQLALTHMRSAFIAAFAIAVAISIAQALPLKRQNRKAT